MTTEPSNETYRPPAPASMATPERPAVPPPAPAVPAVILSGPPPGPPGQPYLARRYREPTPAWLLWGFLGEFGAHDFYLERPGAGVAKIMLTLGGLLTLFLFIGIIPLAAVGIWWLVDAATMSSRLDWLNRRHGPQPF